MNPIRPTFSVVMPAYNAESSIANAIKSVLAQKYTDWELLVVDDCSSDNTASIAMRLVEQDSRIKLIRLKENQRVAGARNAAIQLASGQFIGFLDADDLWLPEILGEVHKKFLTGSKAVHCSYFRQVDETIVGEIDARRVESSVFDFWNPIGNLTGFYDVEFIGKIFQEKIAHEDYLMWRTVALRAKVIEAVDIPLAIYNVADTSLSGNKWKAAKWHWNLLRNGFGFGIAYSCIAFVPYALRSVLIRVGEKLSKKRNHETKTRF